MLNSLRLPWVRLYSYFFQFAHEIVVGMEIENTGSKSIYVMEKGEPSDVR